MISALLQKGYRVRAMARFVEKLACSPWAGHSEAELVKGDMLDPASLEAAAAGCEVAYYLVHSIIARKNRFASPPTLQTQRRQRASNGSSTGSDVWSTRKKLAKPTTSAARISWLTSVCLCLPRRGFRSSRGPLAAVEPYRMIRSDKKSSCNKKYADSRSQ